MSLLGVGWGYISTQNPGIARMGGSLPLARIFLEDLALCIRVFVYLCISHLIHGSVIFNILESYAFQKYSKCWVFFIVSNYVAFLRCL